MQQNDIPALYTTITSTVDDGSWSRRNTYNSNLTCATDAVHSLSKVLDDVHCTTLHCQDSSQLQQPIRDQYYTVSTNQRSVLYCVNQSEISIILWQLIRREYLPWGWHPWDWSSHWVDLSAWHQSPEQSNQSEASIRYDQPIRSELWKNIICMNLIEVKVIIEQPPHPETSWSTSSLTVTMISLIMKMLLRR